MVTIALIITLIRQPILISYMSNTLTGKDELILSSVLSILFLIDIVLNFRTGIVRRESDTIILDPSLIATQVQIKLNERVHTACKLLIFSRYSQKLLEKLVCH